MARVIGQDIPNEFYDRYRAVLTPAHTIKSGNYDDYVREKKDPRKKKPPSVLQLKLRKAFKDSCDCWWIQKMVTEWEMWDPGPRPYWWWMIEGWPKNLYPFQSFMSSTISPYYNDCWIPWCIMDSVEDTFIDIYDPDLNLCREMEFSTWQMYGPCLRRIHIKRGVMDQWKGYLNVFCFHLTKFVPGNYWLLCSDTHDFDWDEWKITANNQPQEYEVMDNLLIKGTGWYKFKVQEDRPNFIIRVHNYYFKYWEYACRVRFRSREHPVPEEQPFFSFE
ncbi:hypothetical protein ES702_07575 [subsurface metagenome]